ncbi:MAG: T9SS type A sorting domain-containing protein [Bacteroidota bacterium]
MKTIKIIPILILFFASIVSGQNNLNQQFTKKKIDAFLEKARKNNSQIINSSEKSSNLKSGAFGLVKQPKIPVFNPEKSLGDTLYIGLQGNDSLVVTGTYFHNKPIVILNSGKLIVRNANYTQIGDIWVLQNGKFLVENSTIHFPQLYFYERSLMAVHDGEIKIENSTLDFGGMVHNMVAIDNAKIKFKNVVKPDFTTNGLYGNAIYDFENVDIAGEFVIEGNSNLHFKNTKTILLWHQFPENSHIDFSFPNGSFVQKYLFSDTVTGIDGVNYSIVVDSCSDVMWGIMPTQNSDVTISNSKIRAIGLWFEGSDTMSVNGLVNNSNYINFTAPLSDRSLKFINSTVQTWSLYLFDSAFLKLSGSIIGEMGSMGKSRFEGQSFMCDGSGGYFWASDTTFAMAGFSSFNSNVRSQRNGILLCAYSPVNMGEATALHSSVLMCVQCVLPQEPKAYDKSCVWNAFIGNVNSNFQDTIIAINGSAYIDKTATSTLMDFSYYKMYYQKATDTSWIEISCDTATEIHNGLLANWNTFGLVSGNYNLKLRLVDNWGNAVDAIKGIVLLPAILSTEENNNFKFNIYPNPAKDIINIELESDSDFCISIKNSIGQELLFQKYNKFQKTITIDIRNLKNGIYYISIKSEKGFNSSVFEKKDNKN